MSSLPYPPGAARAIANARSGGLKPSEAVMVVLAGQHDWSNPQVFVDPAKEYRWDWLRGLNVVLMIAARTRLGDILAQIDQAYTAQIDVVDFERSKAWQVVFTRPRLRTVRWPRAWVVDWLGERSWHAELNHHKAKAKEKAKQQEAAKQTESTYELEPIWN
jgi:hypothetical protein